MRVAIDGQTFASPDSDRGIGVYLRLLLNALAAARPQSFHLLRWAAPPPGLPSEDILPSARMTFSVPPRQRHAEPEFHVRNATVRHYIREHGCDLLFNPNPLQTAVHPLSPPGYVPLVATVHDLTPLALGWDFLRLAHTEVPALYERRLQHLKVHASHLIADSEATRRDAIDKLGFPPEKVTVVYPGVAPVFRAKPAEASISDIEAEHIQELQRISGRYLLVVGGYNPKKNFVNLIGALGRIPRRQCLPVVFAGPIGDTEWSEVEELCRRNCRGVPIMRVGQVSDPELAALYRNALALVFVSLHEGFGFPIVEAMACGCPVITSNVSSMPEIAGDAARLCDPRSPESIAAAITDVLGSTDLQNTMRERGHERAALFMWHRAAEQTIDVFEKCIARQEVRRSASRPAIAWLSPLPPAPGGVSAYSRSLLEELVSHFEVTVVTNQNPVDLPAPMKSLPRIGTREFLSRSASNALPVYNMGNNVEQCADTFHVLLNRPGLTIVHDPNIHGFLLDHMVRQKCSECRRIAWADLGGQLPDNTHPYLAALTIAHGIRGREEADRVLRGGELPDIPGLPCHRLLTSTSLATICHSVWAQRELEANGDAGPVYHLPLGIEYPLTPSREGLDRIRSRYCLDDSVPVFACAGFLEPSRRLESVIRAAKSLAERAIPVRLLFTGAISPGHRDYLERLAVALSIREQLTITGPIASDDEFLACLHVADAVIHLRHPTNGETSATVLRALALGRPVLVSDCDAYRGLPDDCCWKVATGDVEIPLLTEYLVNLASREDIRRAMSHNARRYIEAEHSWASVAARFRDTIQEVVARSRPSRTEGL